MADMIGSNVSLGLTIQRIVSGSISRLFDRVRAQDVTSDRRISVVSLDPSVQDPAPRRYIALSPTIRPGDDVLLLKSSGGTYVLGSIPRPDDSPVTYLTADDLPEYPLEAIGDQLYVGDASAKSTGDQTGTTRVGINGVTANATDRATVVGSYLQGLASRAIAIGHWVTATGVRAIAIGTSARSIGASSVAAGDSAHASEAYAISVGGASRADLESVAVGDSSRAYWYGTAAGKSSSAQHQAVALGRNAVASGTRSIAIGSGANESQADRARIQADELFLMPSSGVEGPSILRLRRSDGQSSVIEILTDRRLSVGGILSVIQGDSLGTAWPSNKKVSGTTTAAMRIAPGNQHTVIWNIGAGSQFHDTGIRQTTDEQWGYIMHPALGWGWVQANRIIAI